MTLADIIVPLAGSIGNEKALAIRRACDGLERRIDALEREKGVGSDEHLEALKRDGWTAENAVSDSLFLALRDLEQRREQDDPLVKTLRSQAKRQPDRDVFLVPGDLLRQVMDRLNAHVTTNAGEETATHEGADTQGPASAPPLSEKTSSPAPSASVPLTMTQRERETIIEEEQEFTLLAWTLQACWSVCNGVEASENATSQRKAIARLTMDALPKAREELARLLLASRAPRPTLNLRTATPESAPRASTVSVEEMAERLYLEHTVECEIPYEWPSLMPEAADYWLTLASSALSALPARQIADMTNVYVCQQCGKAGQVDRALPASEERPRLSDRYRLCARCAAPDAEEIPASEAPQPASTTAKVNFNATPGGVHVVEVLSDATQRDVAFIAWDVLDAMRAHVKPQPSRAAQPFQFVKDATIPSGEIHARVGDAVVGKIVGAAQPAPGTCERHGIKLHDACLRCGAPQCCAKCCKEASLDREPAPAFDDDSRSPAECAQPAPASTPPIRAVAGTSLACAKCGCRWKRHADGSFQLYDADQRPCVECDNAPNAPLRPEMPDDAPASTPDEGEVELWAKEMRRAYNKAQFPGSTFGEWAEIGTFDRSLYTFHARTALRLSSSRTPRVDVRRLLREYFDMKPGDLEQDGFHSAMCDMTAALKSQGVECVGEKESAS